MGKRIKIRKRVLTFFIVFVLSFLSVFSGMNLSKIKAAQAANISISSGSAAVGESVTITVSISSSEEIYATQLYLSYDSSILEYQSGSADTSGGGTLGLINTDTFTSKNFSFTFKVIAVGSSKIAVVGNTRLIDGNEEDMTISSSSGSVVGKALTSYSSDCNLSSLVISPGVLSPAFSPSTTYYTTSVDADVENLVINAVANDSNAKVSVKYANLDMGANKTYVIVTAQNGETKTYTIATTRGDTQETEAETESETQLETSEIEEVEVVVEGARYKVLNNLEEHPFPEGFREFVFTDYEGINLLAAKQESTGLVIMYLENVDGSATSGFFIYDKELSKFYPYNTVSQPDFNYCILPLSKAGITITNLTQTTGLIAGNEVECYTDENRTFFVFYGIDSNGVEGFYKYLISDGTIQSYDPEAFVTTVNADESEDDKDLVSKSYKWYFYFALLACAVILLAAIVIISVQSSRINKLTKTGDEDDLENEDLLGDEDDLEEISLEESQKVKSPETNKESQDIEEIELTEIKDGSDLPRK